MHVRASKLDQVLKVLWKRLSLYGFRYVHHLCVSFIQWSHVQIKFASPPFSSFCHTNIANHPHRRALTRQGFKYSGSTTNLLIKVALPLHTTESFMIGSRITQSNQQYVGTAFVGQGRGWVPSTSFKLSLQNIFLSRPDNASILSHGRHFLEPSTLSPEWHHFECS